jgi:O-methyltransferase
MPISRNDVVLAYRELLGREPESDDVISHHISNNDDALAFIINTTKSTEFTHKFLDSLTNPKQQHIINDRVYETILSRSTYAPWRLSREFLEIYDLIVNHTLVDLYRCWNLWHLVGQVAKCIANPGHFVEIGVWRGGTGVLIARAMAKHGLNLPIYLCDTFRGVVKAGPNDPDYQGGEHSDTSVEVVTALAASAGLPSSACEIVAGVFPDAAPAELRTGNFCFAHIDVDAYQSAKDCFAVIWPRMASGGIVVFDDYGFVTTAGITTLVEELMSVRDGIYMYNLTGQAVFVKLSTMT